MAFKRGFILLLTILFVITATSVASAQISRTMFINGSELNHLSMTEMNTYDEVIVITTRSQLRGAIFALGAGSGLAQTRYEKTTHVFIFRKISSGTWMRVYHGTTEDSYGNEDN